MRSTNETGGPGAAQPETSPGLERRERPIGTPSARAGGSGWRLALLAACYGMLGFAELWPFTVDERGATTAALTYLAFMVRTFEFHGGVLLAVLAAWWGWRHGWRWLLAAGPLVAWAVAAEAISWFPASPLPLNGQPIEVLSANLQAGNDGCEALLRQIEEADPDLMFFQEYTPAWHEQLGTALQERWPHRLCDPRPGCFGSAIYARQPLREPSGDPWLLSEELHIEAQRALLSLDGQDVLLCNVHLYPPNDVQAAAEGRRELVRLHALLAPWEGAALVAGDFNFTPRSRNYATLLQRGFREAHALAGRGRGCSWPARLLPAVGVRIDHMFIRGGLTCASSRVGRAFGSDHRPVMCSLRQTGAAPR